MRIFWQSLGLACLLGTNVLILPGMANPKIQQTESIWKLFSSNAGKFSILMPGIPKEITGNINTKAGGIKLYLFTVERQQEAIGYAVMYNDYPDSYISILNKNNLIEKALDEGRNRVLSQTRGKLISENKISLANYPGREITYEKPGDKIAIHRIYIVNQRMYQVIAETTKQKEKSLTKSIAGFLDSFKLLSN